MVLNFEQVHNFYERLVFGAVAGLVESNPDFSADMLADVACIVLNRLPVRYIRHDVDLMFYMTEQERHDIERTMEEALAFGLNYVRERAPKRNQI